MRNADLPAPRAGRRELETDGGHPPAYCRLSFTDTGSAGFLQFHYQTTICRMAGRYFFHSSMNEVPGKYKKPLQKRILQRLILFYFFFGWSFTLTRTGCLAGCSGSAASPCGAWGSVGEDFSSGSVFGSSTSTEISSERETASMTAL